jgi:hypothetical protein
MENIILMQIREDKYGNVYVVVKFFKEGIAGYSLRPCVQVACGNSLIYMRTLDFYKLKPTELYESKTVSN